MSFVNFIENKIKNELKEERVLLGNSLYNEKRKRRIQY